MKKQILVFVFYAIVLVSDAFAQSVGEEGRITGIVTDFATGKPMEFVNVFIANTMRGTMTDEKGSFAIDKIPFGTQEIICSFVGYEPHRSQIKITSEPVKLTISLRAKAIELNAVQVTGEVDKAWKKQMKKFKYIFLGNTPNKNKCLIVNEEVIDFFEDKTTKALKAVANDLLIIENRALGYKITYLLEHFEVDKDKNMYFGKPKFDFLEPKNEKEKKSWELARIDAYKGSLRHFLHALATDSLPKQNFDLFSSPIVGKDEKVITSAKDMVLYGEISSQRLLKFKNYLKVVYHGRTEYVRNKAVSQTCWIKMTQTTPATFYVNGYLSNPLSILLNGYWAKLGMADELPFEYTPPAIN
ncbi:MAG: carboxypeptidase-like regulatory domain-containing protein [Cytophagales bacterium]|nr:MAG: carboxypeptidase-like regulatory domain-containing protein [Cytophagales bacterium]